jgi:hypothetical protein
MISPQSDFDRLTDYRVNRESFLSWLRDQRADVSAEEGFAILADLLTPVFLYLAEGYQKKTLEVRAWVLLYALRPDLLDGESMSDFARKRGVTKPAIHQKLAELRRVLPGLHINTDSRRGHAFDKATSSERKSRARIAYCAARFERESLTNAQ